MDSIESPCLGSGEPWRVDNLQARQRWSERQTQVTHRQLSPNRKDADAMQVPSLVRPAKDETGGDGSGQRIKGFPRPLFLVVFKTVTRSIFSRLPLQSQQQGRADTIVSENNAHCQFAFSLSLRPPLFPGPKPRGERLFAESLRAGCEARQEMEVGRRGLAHSVQRLPIARHSQADYRLEERNSSPI